MFPMGHQVDRGRVSTPAAHCVDLGAGCGVVGLGILAAGGARRLTSVEVQEGLASFCMFNARNNNLDGAFDDQ